MRNGGIPPLILNLDTR